MTLIEYLAKFEGLPTCSSEVFAGHGYLCGECPPCAAKLAAFPVLLKIGIYAEAAAADEALISLYESCLPKEPADGI